MRGLDHTNFRITIKTEELRDILQNNRETHLTDFQTARKAFEETAIKALKARIEEFQSEIHKKAHMNFDMLAPKCYVKAYDEAIKMLDHHTEETFELNSEAYRSLVEDKWEWAGNFYSNASTYSTNLINATKFIEE